MTLICAVVNSNHDTHLYCLDGILHLEQPPLGTEGVDTSVILVARHEHIALQVEGEPALVDPR